MLRRNNPRYPYDSLHDFFGYHYDLSGWHPSFTLSKPANRTLLQCFSPASLINSAHSDAYATKPTVPNMQLLRSSTNYTYAMLSGRTYNCMSNGINALYGTEFNSDRSQLYGFICPAGTNNTITPLINDNTLYGYNARSVATENVTGVSSFDASNVAINFKNVPWPGGVPNNFFRYAISFSFVIVGDNLRFNLNNSRIILPTNGYTFSSSPSSSNPQLSLVQLFNKTTPYITSLTSRLVGSSQDFPLRYKGYINYDTKKEYLFLQGYYYYPFTISGSGCPQGYVQTYSCHPFFVFPIDDNIYIDSSLIESGFLNIQYIETVEAWMSP